MLTEKDQSGKCKVKLYSYAGVINSRKRFEMTKYSYMRVDKKHLEVRNICLNARIKRNGVVDGVNQLHLQGRMSVCVGDSSVALIQVNFGGVCYNQMNISMLKGCECVSTVSRSPSILTLHNVG